MKVRLHARGKNIETPWAEDLGEAPGRPGARRVRLGNVPFLHAKPTYEDVIIVEPADGWLSWDSKGLPYARIQELIAEDGGRYALVIDYVLVPPTADAHAAFKLLDLAGEKLNIAVEGRRAPKGGTPGRAFLAAPYELAPEQVMTWLGGHELPMQLTLVHPR